MRTGAADAPVVSAGQGVEGENVGVRVSRTRRHRAWVEIVVALVVTVAVAYAVSAAPSVLLLVGGVSLLARYWSGHESVRPGLPRLEHVLRDTTVPIVVAALAVVVGLWTRADLVAATSIAVAGACIALVGAAVRRLRPAPQRVVVVGSAVDVAEATARWAGHREVTLVGTLVVAAHEPLVQRPRAGAFGAMIDLSKAIDTHDLVQADPDLVLVVPGSGIDAEKIRRIGWALEGTRAALAVQSQMVGIAPHRVQHTAYAGTSLIHVTSSRPARLPAAVKVVLDRVVGALLLILFAPLLGALVLAVRRTSTGPGVFRQTRVGRDGSLFTMYKLRTMVTTAEEQKASLMDANEGNGVLFKMTQDPRITPLGRVLRKFSLDELPQLVNVVKGDMSLVGPRPALPEEVAQYTSLERRRLATKPGVTGLWQVSGRSDLDWETAIALDNHYTENWRLADDVAILARTVTAVLGSKGAY